MSILKGKFLIGDDAIKNWRFILFASFLAVLMIASSHSVDNKIIRISELNTGIKELRSEFVETRSQLQELKLESEITNRMNQMGLSASLTPPKKIRIEK